MTASQVTILDGAMGTELKARGADVPDHRSSAWSAIALVRDPGAVEQVHRDYIGAGAQVVTANNDAVVPQRCPGRGFAAAAGDHLPAGPRARP